MIATKLTALVVDDEPQNLGVLLDVLSRADFRVLVAEDGEAALEAALHSTLDVVLLDVRMPGIDGYETCRRLRERSETRDVPVLFVTALGETLDRLRGLAVGSDDYIQKPFRAEEVLARARAYARVTALSRRMRAALGLLRAGDAIAAQRVLEGMGPLAPE